MDFAIGLILDVIFVPYHNTEGDIEMPESVCPCFHSFMHVDATRKLLDRFCSDVVVGLLVTICS